MTLLANYLPDVSRATAGRSRERAVAELVKQSAIQLGARKIGRRLWLLNGKRIGSTKLVQVARNSRGET